MKQIDGSVDTKEERKENSSDAYNISNLKLSFQFRKSYQNKSVTCTDNVKH
jgi:hypothetical protein